MLKSTAFSLRLFFYFAAIMMLSKKVVVVLPAYNAATTIEKTYAEMNLQEKSSLSHRAIAVKKLGEYLKNRIISR